MKNDQQKALSPSALLPVVTPKYAIGAFLVFVFISLVAGEYDGWASWVVGSVILVYALGSISTIGKPMDQLVFWFISCLTIILVTSGIHTLAPLPGGWLISLLFLIGMSTFLWLPFVSKYWRWLYTPSVEGSRNPKPVTISGKTLKLAMAASVISSAIAKNIDDWFGAEVQAYLLAVTVWLVAYGMFFFITVMLLGYTSFYDGLVDRD